MRRNGIVLIGIVCLVWFTGCSSAQKALPETQPPQPELKTPAQVAPPSASAPGDAQQLPKGVLEEEAVEFSAKVEKIDQAKRLVTLRGPGGNLRTIKVDDSVKNLKQVKVGDIVVVAYFESVAFDVKKAGTAMPGITIKDETALAKPGKKPAGIEREVVTVTATLVDIDRLTPSVTLKGPEGNLVVVQVRDPKKLQLLKVGDLVEVTFTEAVAISVEKPGKK